MLTAKYDFRPKLTEHWYFNADVKWAKLGSDVDPAGGTKVSEVHIEVPAAACRSRF